MSLILISHILALKLNTGFTNYGNMLSPLDQRGHTAQAEDMRAFLGKEGFLSSASEIRSEFKISDHKFNFIASQNSYQARASLL